MKTVKTFAFKDRLRGHKDSVVGLSALNGGTVLYSGSREGRFRAWDLNQRALLIKMHLDKRGVEIEEKQLDIQDENEDAKQISYESSNLEPTDIISCFLFTSKSIYAGYEDGSIMAWSNTDGEVLFELVGHTKQVNKLLSLNARLIASCSNDGNIIIWDNIEAKCESIIKLPGQISNIILEKNIIYALCSSSIIVKLNAETFEHIITMDLGDIMVSTFHVENGTYYFATTKRVIEIFVSQPLEEGKEKLVHQGTLYQHDSWILCLAKQGEYLFSGADDKKIKVWDLKTMQEVEEFIGHKDGVTCLEFADKMLYSGSFDHSIRSWDLQEMAKRIIERKIMLKEELFSQKLEAYLAIKNKGMKAKKKPKK